MTRQAGTEKQEIEITPEMIEAGQEELSNFVEGAVSPFAARAVFLAMLRHSGHPKVLQEVRT